MSVPASVATIPASIGPADRVTFFEEQRRHRRATWRLAAASAFAVGLMGVPVSIAVTPLVYGVLLVVGEAANLIRPLPPVLTGLLTSAGELAGRAFTQLDSDSLPGATDFGATLFLVAALLAPGVIVVITLWLGVRRVIQRAGVGGLLIKLGARAPRLGDLEEHQLQNVVEEMAIAAGLPPPRMVILESDAPNAALIGASDADATVVISRRLLDDCSRDQTQAIAGHLLGSMSNGDLRIAFTILSVFSTFGLLVTILDAPFDLRARETLRRLLRLRRSRGDEATEADLVGVILTGRLTLEDDDATARFKNDRPGPWAPLIVINLAVKWTLFLFTTVLVGPMLALLWRARRYLADATGVELTRNPDALSSGLARLVHVGGVVDGSEASAHLFIVAQRATARPNSGAVVGRTHRAGGTVGTNSFLSFHPSSDRRLARLHAQGAALDSSKFRRARPPVQRLMYAVGAMVVGVLFAIGIAAGFVAMGLFVGLSLFLAVIFLWAIHGLFYVLGLLKAAVAGGV